MGDYRAWQGSHQEWVRTCVCPHDDSCCTGNDKDHMTWGTTGPGKDHIGSGQGNVYVHMISPVVQEM